MLCSLCSFGNKNQSIFECLSHAALDHTGSSPAFVAICYLNNYGSISLLQKIHTSVDTQVAHAGLMLCWFETISSKGAWQ